MPRYVAFLRGVMPTNAKMPALKHSFEAAGFKNVRTVLGSGNVVFDAPKTSESALERKAEAAMAKHLGRTFYTIVRPADVLRELLERDPYTAFDVPANAKRFVTFLREPPGTRLSLPVEVDRARILAMKGSEVFTACLPGAKGAAFMALIEKTLGKNVTTRTWDTVRKCAGA